MGRLFMVVLGLQVVLVVLALISCLAAEKQDLRALPRIVWVLVILLFPLVGSIVYFALGRPRRAGAPGEHRRPGIGLSHPANPTRIVAPDDDPDFLRSINLPASTKNEEEELLRRWEEDLRGRDDNPPNS